MEVYRDGELIERRIRKIEMGNLDIRNEILVSMLQPWNEWIKKMGFEVPK